jgi:hypothetical protein
LLHLCFAAGDGSRSGSSDNSLLSTAQILGFADEVFDSKDLGGGEGGVSGQSGSKASLLEQLKQRMPWNQPQPATHQKQILTTMQHQQVKYIHYCQQLKLVIYTKTLDCNFCYLTVGTEDIVYSDHYHLRAVFFCEF